MSGEPWVIGPRPGLPRKLRFHFVFTPGSYFTSFAPDHPQMRPKPHPPVKGNRRVHRRTR